MTRTTHARTAARWLASGSSSQASKAARLIDRHELTDEELEAAAAALDRTAAELRATSSPGPSL